LLYGFMGLSLICFFSFFLVLSWYPHTLFKGWEVPFRVCGNPSQQVWFSVRFLRIELVFSLLRGYSGA
jgi:hypothetical protein